ncbi:ABC transporter [Prevotella sp. HMSC077E09]|uniref:ABC transporter ATP-binding protein n=1 Tax=Prevotella sp. HMSC077E09 TaxID=1739487 RepID=UPI0008A329B1|nr:MULTISPECIES: ABC transporter ATP-binding protein [unclassified Prevotella]OFO74620.1 ABC transporter [Prevotella sp. HMSC077E08]OFP60263.1 ABC transporter [Prevotella sp. HMSC077E09]
MNCKTLLKIPKFKYDARTLLRWLWNAWRGNQLQAVLNASIGLLSVGVSLGHVWAMKRAIDVASGTVEGNLYWAVGVMAVLILLDFALNIAGTWVRNILGIKAQNRMQQRMLDRLLRAEWKGRNHHHSADILNRLEFDVNNVVNFLTETIPSTLSVLAMFIGAFLYLFSMDKVLAVIVIGIFPMFLAVSKIYVGQMRHLTRQVRDSDSKVQSVLQETIQHRMLIKTLESDSAMVERLGNTQSELRHRVVRRTKFSVFSNMVVNFGFAFGYLVAFLWAAIRMSAHTLSFGGMTAFLQLVNRIQGPARNLTKLVPAFVSVFTAAERLMELEEDPLEEQGTPIYIKAPCGIRLQNVGYAYEDGGGDKVIDRLSFDFKPGSCTAILGETGAGKTTLVRMILALVQPQDGKIEIYHGSSHQALSPLHRCNFVYVPQGNTLMSGTIRENLRLGKLDATDEEMLHALHVSCADFVNDLPDGLNTLCSEQGGGLSEGQAQRIAIARSLLRDRSVMLFDEATSALDPDTERQLLNNILSAHDKTIIFITHRPAVIDYCDQTLKLEKI